MEIECTECGVVVVDASSKQRYCKECSEKTKKLRRSLAHKKWREKNKKREINRVKEWRSKNKHIINERRIRIRDKLNSDARERWHKNKGNNWPDKNKEKAAKIWARYRESNRESIRASQERHRVRNLWKFAQKEAGRRALRNNAIPAWADIEKIKKIYREARVITEKSGTQYHVDHIVPLNSKIVCGLHTEGNLRIITADENIKKRNKVIDS